MGFRFDTPENADKYYRVLQNASAALGGKFSVYNHSTMPERWHFVANERIAPIYVVPEIEYALTDRVENGAGLSKGVRTLIPFTLAVTDETYRTMDTTTTTRKCMPCSSRMGPSPQL